MKQELRTKLRGALASTPPEIIQEKSSLAAERLFKERVFQRCEIPMIYLSLEHEADTTPIVLQAWQDRKKVVAPRVVWDSRQLIPIEIRDLEGDVSSGHMGIREPIHGLPVPIGLIDLIIVPGLGFDPFGNRIGRGRGFYDRFLAKPELKATTCGFALEEQVVESLPAGPLDMKVNMLVTDTQVRHFDP